MCLAALLCELFLPIHEWSQVPRYQVLPPSWRSFFTNCIQLQFFFLVLGKNTFIQSKLPTAVCWSREEREEVVKSTCFMSKASQIIRSILRLFSEALNLIIKSKSLPAEVNDLNIELYSLVEVKDKLAIILFCGF